MNNGKIEVLNKDGRVKRLTIMFVMKNHEFEIGYFDDSSNLDKINCFVKSSEIPFTNLTNNYEIF